MNWKALLKSKTVWGSILLAVAATPICPVAWVATVKAAGIALGGVGVRSAIESAKANNAPKEGS